MPLTPADLRILVKRSTNTGEVPTVAPSTDHTDGTWDPLDIYKGELFINTADDKVWYRGDAGIVQIYPAAGGITSLNGLTAATQTFAVGTTGTDFAIVSGTSTHTFNLPTASGSNRGALSSSDWTTFNGKIGGSLTSGRVPYASGASTLTDTSLFVFDGTKLGVGLTTPTATGHFKGSDSTSSNYALKVDNSGGSELWYIRNDGNITSTTTSDATLILTSNSKTYFSGGSALGNYGISVGTAWGTSGQTGLFYFQKSSGVAYGEIRTASENSYTSFSQYGGSTRFSMEVFGTTYGAAHLAGASSLMTVGSGKILIDANSYSSSDIWFGGYASGTPLARIKSTGLFGVGIDPTAYIHVKAGTTSYAQLKFTAGVAPTSPTDGDVYYVDTNDRLMFFKNATACEILSASAVTTESVTSDTTLTVTYNGTTYRLLAIA